MGKVSEKRLARLESWVEAKVASEDTQTFDPVADEPRQKRENVSLCFLLSLNLTEMEILALLIVCEGVAQLSRPDEWEAERALWLAAIESGQKSFDAAFKAARESLTEKERELSDSLHRKIGDEIAQVFMWTDDYPHERGPESFLNAWRKIDAGIAQVIKRGEDLRSCLDFDVFDPWEWYGVLNAAKYRILFGK